MPNTPVPSKHKISPKQIGRLTLYRRALRDLDRRGVMHVHSHELARSINASSAQVRRDLMYIEHTGTPAHGYDVQMLNNSIGRFLDMPQVEPVVIVGMGNLGRAILTLFSTGQVGLTIAAAFDSDPQKTGRVHNGCRCYGMDQLNQVVDDHKINVGILAVPADAAQDAADSLVRAGVRGLVNFAPTRLRPVPGVYIEDIDLTSTLEKVAFFARI